MVRSQEVRSQGGLPPSPGRVPEAVRVKLLGGLRVSVGSRAIQDGEWRLRKAKSLIKLLALAPGHRMHRERLMDVLWPDLGLEAAANNLRQTLHVARRAFESASGVPARYLGFQDKEISLYPGGPLWVDVEAFEDGAATARRSSDPRLYQAALELYSGELLPEDRYEAWAENRREGLRETYLSLIAELARIHEGRGEYEQAVQALREALAEDPLREEAHAGLMRLYALQGRRRAALKQYERFAGVLAQEFGKGDGAFVGRAHG